MENKLITPNTAYESDLYSDFLRDPTSVSPSWRHYFERIYGIAQQPEPVSKTLEFDKLEVKKEEEVEYNLKEGESIEAFSSISTKIADNMEESLTVPTAASIREIPVKALDENRRIINKYLAPLRHSKVSFTHIILWAVVRALVKHPHMNDAFFRKNGAPFRLKRSSINAGLAVDLIRKDGTRLLLVPNVKNAQELMFSEFITAFDSIIDKARSGKLEPDDLMNTSFTLTNPGMIGTTFSSPRLMKGQGLIIASGSIDYPSEFQAVKPEFLTQFAISKVLSVTCTYDHRIIQGAESAEFLSYISKLLLGDEQFYDHIFASLKIPFEPIRWSIDKSKNGLKISDKDDVIEKGAHVMLMINAYRVRGHLLAWINPLGHESYYYPELDPAYYGFTIWDLDRSFHTDDLWKKSSMPLRDIIELLRDTYCSHSGYEFMHIQDPDKKEWIKDRLELADRTVEFSKEEKLRIYKKLVDAETFENFLHTKYVGHKRFSLEGAETLIVMLEKLFSQAADNKLHAITLGMAHRGRLNVLSNSIGKNIEQIFNEFDGSVDPQSFHGSGDVKYHLGDKGTYVSVDNNPIMVILSPNPSHLELVDPVVVGMARALDNEIGDNTFSQVLPVLIHGDAAFAGQGIVAETLNFSQLEGYRTGGTIHIIINNQIGFTTRSQSSRSTIYASDIAKMIQCPIIHVNGNDPEEVCSAVIFAFDYRMRFGSDVIIDMLCYRKYGHNEADEPTYTQPLLYKKIKSLHSVRKVYEAALIAEKVLNHDDVDTYLNDIISMLNEKFESRKKTSTKPVGVQQQVNIFAQVNTRVQKETILKITEAITKVPPGFHANPKILGLLKKRAEMVHSRTAAIDWAMAEALAFGSILLEGNAIRFSGQDSRRGTFSQRHVALTDMETEDEIIPLNNITVEQSKLRIWDSPLSELAVLGFEYGYSCIARNSLTIWEAQFGDFTNGAQAIIDQFISSAEQKWGQTSNLTMLLPHCYDGQGPEHSSARPERFLQLCAEENMIVCNLSTPAQYFHALRRQLSMAYYKPLIIFTPKSMLRMPDAVSTINDLTDKIFEHILDDETIKEPNKINRLLLCTGKIYYELAERRRLAGSNDIAIIRIEQLYPFDKERLAEILNRFENYNEIFWVQEEPKNMGAWKSLAMELIELTNNSKNLRYVGRKESASTATGSLLIHQAEQEQILDEAIS
ncbi:MAG: 2-oxoglutarate dehydrogenase, subunit [Ignavibacteria bacterium]|nr:2-oxoglutarate dehydrogenase, subunit [Ignavibacteria bacterium]